MQFRTPIKNNRKLTKGRLAMRYANGGYRGQIPPKLRRLKKWLRDEKRALKIFKNKDSNYQMNNAHKKIHMKNRIRELEEKIENFSS